MEENKEELTESQEKRLKIMEAIAEICEKEEVDMIHIITNLMVVHLKKCEGNIMTAESTVGRKYKGLFKIWYPDDEK